MNQSPHHPPALTLDPLAGAQHLGRTGLVAIGLGLASFSAWALFAPLDGAVVAEAQVKADLNRRTVQHQEGGIIKQILVRDGTLVSPGQPLVVLEDLRTEAGLDQLRLQLASEQAKAWRLEAERDQKARLEVLPLDHSTGDDPRFAQILQREAALFHTRRQTLSAQIDLVRQQIAQAQEEVRALELQKSSGHQAAELMADELKVNERLLEKEFVNKTRIITLQRQVSDYRMKAGESAADLARARQKVSDLQLRLLSLKGDYVQAATSELKEVGTRIFDLQERLRPTLDAAQRQTLVAPVAGRVVDLRINTLGGVLGPRDPVLDIVPTDGPLLIEARVRVDAVNEVRPGSPADVRLTAYRAATTPLVSGRVSYVSPDRMVDRVTNTPYYAVHVEVERSALQAAGGQEMQAGMPAEVFIRTGARTGFDYLMDPLIGRLRRAMRES